MADALPAEFRDVECDPALVCVGRTTQQDDIEPPAVGRKRRQAVEVGTPRADDPRAEDQVGFVFPDASGGEPRDALRPDLGSHEPPGKGDQPFAAAFGFAEQVVDDPSQLPPCVVREGPRAAVELRPVVGCDLRVGVEELLPGDGCRACQIGEKTVAGHRRQPGIESAVARQQDGTALGRRSRASAVLEAEPRLAQLPVAQFAAFQPDGGILRACVGVNGAGVEACREDGRIEITFIPARFVCFEQCLGALHGGEVVDETGIAADAEEPSPVDGMRDIPVGTAECRIEVSPFAQNAVGDQQSVERGTQVFEVGEERLAREFVVGYAETAVGMLQREQQRSFSRSSVSCGSKSRMLPMSMSV